MGSQTNQNRGHSRNLSTSSIGSTTSSVSYRDDGRRRPPPLVVATHRSSQPSLSIDTFRSPPDSPATRESYQGYSTQSPGYSTPTSATYSTGPGSPRFSATFRSPTSSITQSGIFWDRSPGRRLSVPSGTNPFQSQPSHSFQQSYFSPLPSSHASTFSGMSSVLGSPTSSIFSPGRPFGPQETELKRRTWHPESRPTVNSPLANSSMAYLPSTLRRPTLSQNNSITYGTRLPGIESFDHLSARPSTPPRRQPSPMQMDTPSHTPISPAAAEHTVVGPYSQRSAAEWDMSLHQNLDRLGINNGGPPAAEIRMGWLSTSGDPLGQRQPHGHREQGSMNGIYGSYAPRHGMDARQHRVATEQATAAIVAPSTEPTQTQPQQPPPETPRRNKRHGWYAGPPSAHRNILTNRPSPEDSSSSDGVATPSTSSVGETNPSIRNSNGWLEEITNPGPGTTPPATFETQKVTTSMILSYELDLSLLTVKTQTYPPTVTATATTSNSTTHHHHHMTTGTYSLPSNGHALSSSTETVITSSSSTPRRNGSNMLRLEALVAVATSEEK